MSKKISHSAWDKYMTCPKLYDLHYNVRLRPLGTSSALVFGVAIDEALNHLLLSGKLDESIQIFRDKFKWENMAGVVWDDRDSDRSIVNPSDVESQEQYPWACMRVKGRMLLEAYYKNIFPLIEEVESVQKDLSNRPGILDAVVQLRGYGRVLLDHKTAARPYDSNAVRDSTQLALYARDQGIKTAGFAILIKQIRKNTKRICLSCGYDGSYVRHKTCPNIINGTRCHGTWDESHTPEAQTQLLVDDVPEINKKLVAESISQVEEGIKHGHFPRNLRACGKIYGKPCPYINYCWQNDETGLEYKQKTKEKK